MSYSILCIANLANPGGTINAQMYDSDGVASGAAITTGINELHVSAVDTGTFSYYATVADGFAGSLLFYDTSDVTNCAAVAINPQETENADAKTSSRSTITTAQVNAEVDTALADYDAPTKAELDAGLAALNDPSANDVVTALMAYVLESGKAVDVALLDIWSVIVGDALADDANNPTSITYDSPDGTVQITHTLTTTTRAIT